MQTRINRNLICSVLCVDIVEHSRKLEFDQFHRKARLQGILQAALQNIPEGDRVILDTGDGAAIAFFGAPEEALTVALFIADGIEKDEGLHPQDPIELRSCIHLGPVRVMNDINGIVHFVGDGLNAAQRIMSMARPGNTVVSRQYFDIVAPENPDAFRMLTPLGKRTDREGREYELFVVGRLDAARGMQWGVWGRRMMLQLRYASSRPAMRWSAAGACIAVATGLLLPHMKNAPSPEPKPLAPAAIASPALQSPVASANMQTATLEEQAKPKQARPRKAHRQKPVAPVENPSGTLAETLEPAPAGAGVPVGKRACSEAERMLSKCS